MTFATSLGSSASARQFSDSTKVCPLYPQASSVNLRKPEGARLKLKCSGQAVQL